MQRKCTPFTIKILKIQTPEKNAVIILKFEHCFTTDAERMANSVDPDQTAPLICAYTVCPDLSVRKLKIITVGLQTRATPWDLILLPCDIQTGRLTPQPHKTFLRHHENYCNDPKFSNR